MGKSSQADTYDTAGTDEGHWMLEDPIVLCQRTQHVGQRLGERVCEETLPLRSKGHPVKCCRGGHFWFHVFVQ